VVENNLKLNYREYYFKQKTLNHIRLKFMLNLHSGAILTALPARLNAAVIIRYAINLFDRIKESLFPYAAEVNFFLNGEPTWLIIYPIG